MGYLAENAPTFLRWGLGWDGAPSLISMASGGNSSSVPGIESCTTLVFIYNLYKVTCIDMYRHIRYC